MSFAILALDYLLKQPPADPPGGKKTAKPAVVDVAKMQSSLADLASEVLRCYHKTAHFRTVDKVQQPWERQSQYAAENSAVVRIRFSGVSGAAYEMAVAVMVKEGKVRTAVVADNAKIPYNKKCALENWTGSEASALEAKKPNEKK